jgi:uncharacterized protein with FMN-binding domain
MKRAFAAIVATVVGLIVLLDFKTHSVRQAAQPAPGTSASNVPSPSATSAKAAPSATPSRSAKPQTQTVTGSTVRTRYGDVEIQVVLAGTQITSVVPIRLPDSNDVDQEIDQQAVPILIQETLAAQGANIQAVSGATYTSDGYIRSLQSALDESK